MSDPSTIETSDSIASAVPLADPNLFKLNQGNSEYVSDGVTQHKFGIEAAHSDYVMPIVRIKFYGPNAQVLAVPPIYIRLGGAFQSALNQGYAEAQGIFGSPNAPSTIFSGTVGTAVGALGDSLLAALQRQLVAGMAGVTGYLASAGQTGRAQIEFLTRKFLNNFQQVVYQGPRFRMFNLPFSMKPTSEKEALTMIEIIHNLRTASLPKTGTTDSAAAISDFNAFNQDQEKFLINSTGPNVNDREKYPKGAEDEAFKKDLAFFQANFSEFLDSDTFTGITEGQPLVFTYPDMIKFEIILYEKGAPLTVLFASDYCVIENLNLDYGSSAKMTFFQMTRSGKRKYIPTEVSMTLSLKEMTLITGGYQTASYLADHVIF